MDTTNIHAPVIYSLSLTIDQHSNCEIGGNKKGCFPSINECLESREVLVKFEINVLTYRQDKGIEHTGLERV